MKTLILIFLIFVTVNLSWSQRLPVGFSTGLEINDKYEIQQLSGTLIVQPQLTFGIIKVSVVGLTLLKQGDIPKVYGGSELGVKVWTAPDQRTSIVLTARYLYGSTGKQLIGAGAEYEIDRTTVKITGDWNYKDKTALGLLGASFDLIPSNKPNRNLSHKLKIKGKINKFLTHKLKQERI